MITVADAIKRIQKKHPNERIVSGLDMGTFYAFSMISRSVNPTSVFDIPVQPAMNAIRKNGGEEFLFHMFHSTEGELKGDIDVAQYLDAADAAFARKMKMLVEEG